MSTSHSSIDTELLINYAHGLLDPEVASRIREALLQDELLRGQYEGILYLMKTHPDKDPADVMETMMAELDTRMEKTSGNKKTTHILARLWKPLAIAASVILIISIGISIWKNQPRDPVLIAGDVIRQQYRDPAAEDVTERERGEVDTSWYADFSQGNYTGTLRKLSSLPDSSLLGREEFFFGLCYLKTSPQQTDKAEKHLQKSARLQGDYQHDAWYYLGIIQLLKKDVEGAKKYLHQAGHPRAKELLERLPQ